MADAVYMDRALFLAERGRGRTTPNPLVGAVVVTPSGIVAGQGAHLQAGTAHAEVRALEAAGEAARGATLYCTLEPCCHRGRTGPCVERIVEAGVARVVAAVRDPNPLVSGGGFAYLRAHGIAVDEGLSAAAARRLNAPFFTWVTQRRPFVVLKEAVSSDGCVGRPGTRVKLTGAEADRWLHRQRAEIDAIAVGSGTVLADDPQLTARGSYRYRPLTRAIVDWRFRTPGSARVFSTLDAGPVIMVVLASAVEGHSARRGELDELQGRGVVIEQVPGRDLRAVLTSLAAREIQSLLVEGGPRLHDAFADAGLADRVQRVKTPHRLDAGQPEAAVFARLAADAGRPARRLTLGDDELVEWDVHGTD